MKESEIVFNALKEELSATVSDLAIKTGMQTKRVSAAIHHLISSGKVFQVGTMPIFKSREVNLYSVTPKLEKTFAIQKQTWLSPVMQ